MLVGRAERAECMACARFGVAGSAWHGHGSSSLVVRGAISGKTSGGAAQMGPGLAGHVWLWISYPAL